MSPEAIEHVDELLQESGGRLAVATLVRQVEIPRARLAALVRAWRQRHACHVERLKWTKPGTVWAMDWTETESPVEAAGVPCRWTLLVRDLAGCMQLAAIPAEHATARGAAETLDSLFTAHGAPLVLKTDNGSNVAEGAVRDLLVARGIAHLRSPLGTPRYNGSIEAGIGSLKARLRAIASMRGRPSAPTCDDLEEARLESNALSRPWGVRGQTPEERWREREPEQEPDQEPERKPEEKPERRPSAAERSVLAAAIAAASRDEAIKIASRRSGAESGRISVCPAEADGILNSLDATDRAIVARRAIRRSLEALGYLISRRIPISSTQLHG